MLFVQVVDLVEFHMVSGLVVQEVDLVVVPVVVCEVIQM